MLRSWMLGGLCALLLASTVCAERGVVKTENGQVFEGDITESGDQVIVVTGGIRSTIARNDIRSLTYASSIGQEYRRRLAQLSPYDVRGRLELAKWLFANRAYSLAEDVLTEARNLQPRNRDVLEMAVTVERQVEMEQDEAKRHAPVQLADAASGAAAASGATSAPTTEPAPAARATRVVTPAEINLIRQDEWQLGQPVRVSFLNDVRRLYIAREGIDPADFNRAPPAAQAWAILQKGTPGMRKDVILGDPPAMTQFRIIQRSMLGACAACHSRDKIGGNFALRWPAVNDADTYTNFLILQKYSHKEGDRVRLMIDRDRPEDSLLVQFALPPAIASPPHPAVPQYQGVFHTAADRRLTALVNWITNLNPVVPDYSSIDLVGGTDTAK